MILAQGSESVWIAAEDEVHVGLSLKLEWHGTVLT